MGCTSSLCSESEMHLTQDFRKEFTDKSTGFIVTEGRENMSYIKNLASIALIDSEKSLEYLYAWLENIKIWIYTNNVTYEDVKSFVTISPNGHSIVLKHEFSFIKSYTMVSTYCKKMFKTFNELKFNDYQKLLLSFSPLTICIYLKIGLEIDCGIGIERPMDNQKLSKFISFSNEAENIAIWCGSLIPTGFFISALGLSRTVHFYIFDGHKFQNYSKCMSLFEFFGSPLDQNLKSQLLNCNSEAVTAVLELNDYKIITIGMILNTTDYISLLQDDTETKLNWDNMKNLLHPDNTLLELSREGYTLHQITAASDVLVFN
jgi:hypothetical protein